MRFNGRIFAFFLCLHIVFLSNQNIANASETEINGEINTEEIYFELEAGRTKPIYSTDDAIVERVYVESEVDTDGDGQNDKVAIDVYRPNTPEGIKVPVIYEMSPYRAGTNSVSVHELNRELYAVGEEESNDINMFSSKAANIGTMERNLGTYGNYYVPRGYAVVLGYSLGNGPTEGCPTIGDMNEIMATIAVIDWLNGRTNGYTEDGEETVADWSTGDVGMIGLSFNGSLANGAATTGVDGLKTIIPGGAISSWYDYSRSYGAIQAQQGWDLDILAKYVLTRENPGMCDSTIQEISEKIDRKTADYNEFWDERNYLNSANNIEASVLVVHGLRDWNVKTKQFGQWWAALKENDIDRKLFLHQGGHSMPRNEKFQILQHRWFDHWLYGIENNIMEEPAVTLQREDGTWSKQSDWPHPEVIETKFYLHEGEEGSSGSLSLYPLKDKSIMESFSDDAFITAENLVVNIEENHSNRLAFLTNELSEDLLLSGAPIVKIRASIDKPVTNLTAMLIDYDGESSKIITRGWMDPQNYESISYSKPITPNEEYTFEWGMQPNDYVFKAGHKIGIVIMQSDYSYTIRPKAGTILNVSLGDSEVILPIVGNLDEVPEVDKSGLQEVLDKIKSENLEEKAYTVESWQQLQLAITSAEEVIADTNATSKDVENALEILLSAYSSLEKKPVTIETMQDLLQSYIESGDLKGPLVNQLYNRVDQASHQLDKGQMNQSIKKMHDFIKHINNESMQEHISKEAKENLVSHAEELIKVWEESN